MTAVRDTTPPRMTVGVAPGRLPALGHLVALGRRPLQFIASLPAHGDLVEIELGTHRAWAVCHPDLAHQVLRDGRTFDKGGPIYEGIRPLMGNGLATCAHGPHQRQRRSVQPTFHPDRMPGYGQIMSGQIAVALQAWRDGQVIDVLTAMNEITAQVTARTLFGTGLTAAEVTDLHRDLTITSRQLISRIVTPPGLGWLPIGGERRFRDAITRLDELVYRVIATYRRNGDDHGEMLSTLVAVRDEHDQALSDQEIRDQVSTFLAAGTETTAILLVWALHLLARHPQVEQQLHAEVDTVLAGNLATYADAPRLELTRRVLTETLRLYPPTWISMRTVTTDTHLAGQTLPAGITVLFSPYMIHHRADLYPDPDIFDPDRWRPERAATLPRGAFIPFGGGARKCIGDTFSLLEATLALASITAHWRLTPANAGRVHPRPGGSLRPPPLPMRLHHRVTGAPAELAQGN